MINALRSELFLIRKRPAVYIIGSIWILCQIGFGLLVPYIAVKALRKSGDDAQLASLTELVSFSHFPYASVSGFATFGAALFAILGAVAGGSEQKWGTWKVRLTQGPTRIQTMAAKITAAIICAVIIAFITQLVSLPVAYLTSRSLDTGTDIAMGSLVASFGLVILISVVACLVGFGLAIMTKSQALALSISLVWIFIVETTLATLLSHLHQVAFLQKILFTHAGNGVASALLPSTSALANSPDQMSLLSAILVLVVYGVLATGISSLLIKHRDIA